MIAKMNGSVSDIIACYLSYLSRYCPPLRLERKEKPNYHYQFKKYLFRKKPHPAYKIGVFERQTQAS